MAEQALTIADTTLKATQIQAILAKTPKEHIQMRPIRGGGQAAYVSVSYVTDKLNQVFGWLWGFEITEKIVEKDLGQVVVKGKLIIKDQDNNERIVKEQFGSSDIKKDRQGKIISLGDDLKAASSDALKKCASLLGVAHDVYSGEVKVQGNAYSNNTTQYNQQVPNTTASNVKKDKGALIAKKDGVDVWGRGKYIGKKVDYSNKEQNEYITWLVSPSSKISDFDKKYIKENIMKGQPF